MMKMVLKAWLFVMTLVVMTACSPQGSNGTTSSAQGPAFRILAGSELKDVAPLVVAFGQSQGVTVQFEYTGSLDAVDTLGNAHNFDAVWVSHGKYLQLVPQVMSQMKASEKTMYSRVVLGVKPEKARELGWNLAKANQVSWHDVLAAVKAGKLRLAVTNPAGSNTGFVTLVGVASELSGKGDALEEKDIPTAALKDLFSGVTLTSGSSGDLADKFKADTSRADAIVNYEASIAQLQKSGVSLEVVIPKEGVITADYPLMLLKQSGQQAFYDKLIAYVRSDAAQQSIARDTFRTPLAGDGSGVVVNELPFPNSVKVVDALLRSFMDEYSRPASSFFVLDTSGSMNGERISDLKNAMYTLAQGDGSVSGRFAAFRAREHIFVTSFSNVVQPTQSFELSTDAAQNRQLLNTLAQRVNGLSADGGTAIYDALMSVYQKAQAEMRSGKRNASIVLLTDGDNNTGMRFEEFAARVADLGTPRVPVYAILYGEGNVQEMNDLASRTGGKTFDARTMKLKSVMKTIRAYQ